MGTTSFAQRVDVLLRDVGTFFGDLVEAPTSDAHQLIDEQLQRFWQLYYELKKRREDNELTVAVLALAKSGEGWRR